MSDIDVSVITGVNLSALHVVGGDIRVDMIDLVKKRSVVKTIDHLQGIKDFILWANSAWTANPNPSGYDESGLVNDGDAVYTVAQSTTKAGVNLDFSGLPDTLSAADGNGVATMYSWIKTLMGTTPIDYVIGEVPLVSITGTYETRDGVLYFVVIKIILE